PQSSPHCPGRKASTAAPRAVSAEAGRHPPRAGSPPPARRPPPPPRVPRVGDTPERLQQVVRGGARNGHLASAEQAKLATGQHGRRRWHGGHGSRRRSRSWQDLMITAGPCLLT